MIRSGIYTHYKGGTYRLLFIAYESTNGRPRDEIAVYVSLTNGTIWCRALSEFTEDVEWPDGVKRPRFVFETDVP